MDDPRILKDRMLELEAKLGRAERAINSARFELSKSFNDLEEAKYVVDKATAALAGYQSD